MKQILLKKPHEFHKDTGIPLDVIKEDLVYLIVKSRLTLHEFEIHFDKIDRYITTTELVINKQTHLETINTQSYYKGKDSLYKFAEEWRLNSYEFDLIKRIVRCRHKGKFKEDLQKTKDLIDIYLKEYGTKI